MVVAFEIQEEVALLLTQLADGNSSIAPSPHNEAASRVARASHRKSTAAGASVGPPRRVFLYAPYTDV